MVSLTVMCSIYYNINVESNLNMMSHGKGKLRLMNVLKLFADWIIKAVEYHL